jgi:Family of unknown function (DUF5330)
MRFLLRVAFWLGIVVLLLPAAPSQHSGQAGPLRASEAVSAASAAMSDMRQFCSRQPDACAIGSQVLSQFGLKAQSGAKMLYEFLNDRLGAESGVAAGPGPEKASRASTANSSQHTLTPADLAPAWRGFSPRREADAKHPA